MAKILNRTHAIFTLKTIAFMFFALGNLQAVSYAQNQAQNPPPVQIQYQQGILTVVVSNCAKFSQILSEISHVTGLKVNGAANDECFYGNYGPGKLEEIISRLLDGTNFDYIFTSESQSHPHAELTLAPRGLGMPESRADSPTGVLASSATNPASFPDRAVVPATSSPNSIVLTPEQILERMFTRQNRAK